MKEREQERRRKKRLTLLEAEVWDFVDWRALSLHEGEELIQEQLLFRVREPAALTADLHAAHHILLRGKHVQDLNRNTHRGIWFQIKEKTVEPVNRNINILGTTLP